jgi:hypothetical protein
MRFAAGLFDDLKSIRCHWSAFLVALPRYIGPVAGSTAAPAGAMVVNTMMQAQISLWRIPRNLSIARRPVRPAVVRSICTCALDPLIVELSHRRRRHELVKRRRRQLAIMIVRPSGDPCHQPACSCRRRSRPSCLILHLHEHLFDIRHPKRLIAPPKVFVQCSELANGDLVALDAVLFREIGRISSTKRRAMTGGSSIGFRGMRSM